MNGSTKFGSQKILPDLKISGEKKQNSSPLLSKEQWNFTLFVCFDLKRLFALQFCQDEVIINYVKLHAEPAEGKTLDISKYIVNENVVLLALVLITYCDNYFFTN